MTAGSAAARAAVAAREARAAKVEAAAPVAARAGPAVAGRAEGAARGTWVVAARVKCSVAHSRSSRCQRSSTRSTHGQGRHRRKCCRAQSCTSPCTCSQLEGMAAAAPAVVSVAMAAVTAALEATAATVGAVVAAGNFALCSLVHALRAAAGRNRIVVAPSAHPRGAQRVSSAMRSTGPNPAPWPKPAPGAVEWRPLERARGMQQLCTDRQTTLFGYLVH